MAGTSDQIGARFSLVYSVRGLSFKCFVESVEGLCQHGHDELAGGWVVDCTCLFVDSLALATLHLRYTRLWNRKDELRRRAVGES